MMSASSLPLLEPRDNCISRKQVNFSNVWRSEVSFEKTVLFKSSHSSRHEVVAHNILTKSLLKLTSKFSPTSFHYKKANGLLRKPTLKVSQQALWLLPSVSYKLGNRKCKEIIGFNNIKPKLVFSPLLIRVTLPQRQNLSVVYWNKMSCVGT